MGFFGHQFLESNPKQKIHAYRLLGSARTEVDKPNSRALMTNVQNREVQSTSSHDLVIEDKQEVDSSTRNVVVLGTVETNFGEIVAGETVVLYSESLNERYSTRSGDHGELVFTDVRPATDYRVTVSSLGMYKPYTQSPVDLSFNHASHNIVLETLPVGTLTGTVVDSYDRPVTGLELSIRPVEKDSWSVNVATDTSGAFSVAGFPKGEFQVSSGAQQFFKATGLTFDPADGWPVNLTVDLGPYSLGGHIYDESGQTFDGAHVVVIWTVQHEGITSRSTRQVTADITGAFLFTGLGPGDHELIVSAWDGGAFKQTARQTVNLGVDPGELTIMLNTL